MHVLGTSNRWFGGVPLPFDLTAHGAPGCFLYTDWLLLSAHVTDWRLPSLVGEAHLELPLPLDPSLLGATLFSQWLFIDPAANRLGLETSQGVRATIEPALPADGLAIVRAFGAAAGEGIVATHFFPVLRLVSAAQ
jgi:hypothetical protein